MRPAPRPQLLAINPLPTLLAARLGLPWVNAIEKIRDTKAQKQQANTYHQCANLDGVFAVVAGIPHTPVMLIDDITDSGWTFTIAAANLCCSSTTSPIPADLHHRRRPHPHQWRCARCGRNRHARRAQAGGYVIGILPKASTSCK